MNEYLFDVKLFASLRIWADTKEDAEKSLQELLNGATANFGADKNGDPILGAVTLDTEDGGDLIEVNGECV